MTVFRLTAMLSLFLMDYHILAFSPWQIVKNRFGKAIDMPPPEIIPPPTSPAIMTAAPTVSTMTSTLVDKNLKDVFAANQEWISSMKGEDPAFFDKLGSVHQPDYMWIGCADARVPANEVMGKEAGTVFVVRNVANMVVNTDVNLMAALQYAVNVLKVSHIIVCGHYDCGGIRAASANKDHQPPLENWLRNIRDVFRLHTTELNLIKDPETRHRRLVELNVIEQCINLFKTGAIQRRRIETHKAGMPYTTPRIHAVVFDPKTGVLQPLQVSFRDYINELSSIYDLYGSDDS